MDLRDFGLDDSDDERARRESTLLDLKAAARLNIPTRRSHRRRTRDRSNEDVGSTTSSTSFDEDDDDEEEEEEEDEEEEEYLSDIDPSVQLRRPRHHHHHHHHHHRSSSGSCSGGASLQSQHQYAGADARQSGSSSCCVGASSGGGSGGFNFRFAADKWRSAPSLPGSLLESARSLLAAGGSCSDYTRVASVPVDLDLCGGGSSALLLKAEEEDDDYREATLKVASSEERTLSAHDEEERLRDIEMMAEVVMNHDGGEVMPEDDIEPGKIVGEEKARMRKRAKEMMKSQEGGRASDVLADVNSDMVSFIDEENQNVLEEKPVLNSTVKTQDRVESTVMEIAKAMENDPDAVVDEAIRHLQREVEEAALKNSANVEELTAALENAQRMKQSIMENKQERLRVKNNASYELAQQNTVDEACVRPPRRRRHVSKEESTSSSPPGSTRQRRVLNNASYELAQQNDVMKNLSFGFGKQFQRMDACEELIEPVSGRNSTLKLSELVEEMRGSTSNLESVTRDYVPDVRTYSKSTENVSARAGGSRKRGEPPSPPEEPQTLLDQIKKNSDFFSTSGENAGNGHVPAVSSPCVPSALDDEVDYPCLLENKPIIAARRSATENTLQLLSDGKTNNYVDDKEEEEGEVVVKLVDNVDEAYIKKSFIGEYYPDTLSPTRNYPHAVVSKSCENVTSSSSSSSNGSGSGNNNNNVPGERLWRVVVEKQRVEKENGNGTSATAAAAARVTAASSPLLYEPAAVAASAGESAGWLSSPASAVDVRRGEAASPPLGTNNSSTLPSTRASEMSATAAKRLAMSGTAASSTTSMNTINNASSASNIINNNKEERKKGGLGGFLQRFSKLRFSGRSKVPRSEVQKKSANNNSGAGENVSGRVVVQQAGQLRKKNNEPDYIIIPLHPPSDEVEREKERTMLQQRQQQDALAVAAGPDVERSASNVR